jgi:5-formyltetrahydrofolate cyclo-ligase
MMAEIVARKRALRRQMRELEGQFGPAQIAPASLLLCDQLRPQPVWQACRRILAFLPMPSEPDIRPLLEEALAEGKTVTLPSFDPTRGVYEARQVSTLSGLQPRHFGIPEPAPESPKFDLIRLDFLLVPGVAYDVNGRRLGRGKGYFDRLLAEVTGHKCGVAFDWQVVPEVPAEPHDMCVDSLLTPMRWLCCRS